MATRKYAKTLFDAATFARLWESDPRGVKAEAKARGAESKLARRVKAQAPAKNTRTVTPKVTRKADPEKAIAWKAAELSGLPVGSGEFWDEYRAIRALQAQGA